MLTDEFLLRQACCCERLWIPELAGEDTGHGGKDYRSNGRKKQLTLNSQEFIRRFALHILPLRFVRIRHYGMLSSTWKRAKFAVLRKQLKLPQQSITTKLHRCPCCKTGTLITIAVFARPQQSWRGKRGPHEAYKAGQNTNAC